MPRVVVTTDDGTAVWTMDGIDSWMLNALGCPTNQRGSALASGIRRAVQDAEAIQEGRDPERLSEKVMRLMAEQRRESG